MTTGKLASNRFSDGKLKTTPNPAFVNHSSNHGILMGTLEKARGSSQSTSFIPTYSGMLIWHALLAFFNRSKPFVQACVRTSFTMDFFRECNRTHLDANTATKALVEAKLPHLFQSNILCAGTDIGRQGSCTGDSGGPLMAQNRELKKCN